jgi:hypothetical protein
MLLVKSIIFLYEPNAVGEILNNHPVLSLDIEFAKYMKLKPQEKRL